MVSGSHTGRRWFSLLLAVAVIATLVSMGVPGALGAARDDDYLTPGSRVQLATNLSSKRDSQSTRSSRYSVETTMDFHLRAAQDDVPSGMQHLLSILSEAIQVQPVPPVAAAGSLPL